MAEENKEEAAAETNTGDGTNSSSTSGAEAEAVAPGDAQTQQTAPGAEAGRRHGRRAEKVGIVASDKMEKTVVVRVDRLVKHPKYRRFVRRTSKFMAHDEKGAGVGDKVRIVETRPLSARKRWRVVEIVQKAEK